MSSENVVNVGVHKLNPHAFDPVYATDGSACFDLRACFPPGHRTIQTYVGPMNRESALLATSDWDADPSTGLEADPFHINIPPGERVLIPTHLIFDIPKGWSLRVHVRSSVAIKGGLVLANGEGIVDSDYTNQLYLPVRNTTNTLVRVNHGDRICQGELVPTYRAVFSPCPKPEQKGNRTGGIGSTGKN